MAVLGFASLAAVLVAGSAILPVAGSGAPAPIYTTITREMFPTAWRARDVGAAAVPLTSQEVERSRELVRRAMDKYSPGLIRDNLRAVYVVQKLVFYGLSYGGTNSLDTVYLANRGVESGFTNRYLEESFHHEFSSILLRNYPEKFDRTSWLGANAPGFKYWGNGTEAIRRGIANTRYLPSWHEKGLLAQYASASMEEDFNMFAEALFCGGQRFWNLCQSYPRLMSKAKTAIRFYRSLDPSLDDEAFHAFAETALAENRDDLDEP